jgi:CBS domain-containing protein
MRVTELMRRDAVTVGARASGHDGERLVGIVTESDVLRGIAGDAASRSPELDIVVSVRD